MSDANPIAATDYAARREAAIIRALAEAPELTPEQTSAIVGLLLVNTEARQPDWAHHDFASGGEVA